MVTGVTGIPDNVLAKGDGKGKHDMAVLSILKTAWNNNLKFSPVKIHLKTRVWRFFDSYSPQMAGVKLMFLGKWMYHSAKKNLKLQRHGELPKVLLLPTNLICRTTKRASENWHTMVLGDQTSKGLWSHQGWADQKSSASILWPKGKPHHTSGWVHEGPQCSAPLERQTCHICIQNNDITRNRVLQIEKELFGVVYSLKRLHHYVFGNKIKVQTEHKPLIPIWKKWIAVASPWLQYLLLRIAKYDVQLT